MVTFVQKFRRVSLSPQIKNWLLDLLFPPYCIGCDQEGELLCSGCRNALKIVPPSCFICKKWVPETLRVNPGRTCETCRSATFIYAYFSPLVFDQDPVRKLIHALKYKRIRSIGDLLGRLLADYCRNFNVNFPEELAVVSLPLHSWRKRRRGFNQAEIVAHAFLTQFNSGVLLMGILKRNKNIRPQVELSGEERRQNIVGVFSVVDSRAVEGKQILLIDDVKTTGATLEEAARVLKEAGAKRIWAMTAAH